MIYTFGCSVTKWHWPTWADWLGVYQGSVTNLAYKGYGNDNIYWTLLNRLKTINREDHVIIMWSQNHRFGVWYDNDWVLEKDMAGFFPDTQGRIWFSNNEPYRGLYRTHPDYQLSLTHMIISELQTIYNTQLLLENHGCNYTMMFVHNPFLDCRPIYKPKFEFVWHKKEIISEKEVQFAKQVLDLEPVQNIVNLIDWKKFADVPKNPFDPKCYSGMWEYFFNKKDYLIYSHDHDPHPVALTQHDFALEKILQQDPKQGKFRSVAIDISKEAMSMAIPEFNDDDYVAEPEAKLLHPIFKQKLDEL